VKRICWNLSLVIMLIIVCGCSEGDSAYQKTKADMRQGTVAETKGLQSQSLGPDDMLLKYLNTGLNAERFGKSKETYQLLSNKDKEITSEKEYLSNSKSNEPNASHELMSLMKDNISYTIKNSVIDKSVAKIEIETSRPKLPSSLLDLLLCKNSPEVEKKVIAYLHSPDLQFDKNLESFTLVKESEGWRVFLDFATKNKIKLLVEEAEALVPSLEMLSPIDGAGSSPKCAVNSLRSLTFLAC